MAYCRKCGTEIDDEAVICPKCGVPQNKQTEEKHIVLDTTKHYNRGDVTAVRNEVLPDSDGPSLGWAFLGFIIPLIVGLILYLIWKDTKPNTASSIVKGIKWKFIIFAIVLVFYCCSICVAAGGY